MIEIVGHFGTLYSYATVGGRVAEALARAGLLGRVSNLDAEWHPRWEELRKVDGKPTHCVLFTAPNHYMGTYAGIYGRKKSAIYVSPNTNRMDDEQADTIRLFGLALAPSKFCVDAVVNSMAGAADATLQTPEIARMLIGCPVTTSVEARRARRERLLKRTGVLVDTPLTVLHLTSDQAWPGRKGTEELLLAWSILKRAIGSFALGDDWQLKGARLVIHGPASLHKKVIYMARDHEIDESVTFIQSEQRGDTDERLARLYEGADLVVQPSRCEGFGMMFLAALVAGVPLVATCSTGHAEVLMDWPGTWTAVPTPISSSIAFEVGGAPIVEPAALANAIHVAALPEVRRHMLKAGEMFESVDDDETGTWSMARHHMVKAHGADGQIDTWSLAAADWVARLREWMEE